MMMLLPWSAYDNNEVLTLIILLTNKNNVASTP